MMIINSQFSDPQAAKQLVETIHSLADHGETVRIMEVCGTHTMEIGRQGIRQLLPKNVELLSGPGCPVCVTPAAYIDALCECALTRKTRIVTFGDLFRVPGDRTSLAEVKSRGATIDIVTSPLSALEIAENNPRSEIIVAAVGFETTIPSAAAAIKAASAKKLTNISFLIAHRLVPPALEALLTDPSLKLNCFLLPGHVSAIIGQAAYEPILKYGTPGAIAGFEPLDILGAIASLLDMLNKKTPRIQNHYTRVAHPDGNPWARALTHELYEPCDSVWRGIGMIPQSGLRLRPAFAQYDAAIRYGLSIDTAEMPHGCSCGDVLKGRTRPDACPLFGNACTPDHPIGPCMVSSEGSCAAYFKYGW